MGLVYLRHPDHGEMTESSDSMVQVAKSNGWVEFDPTVVVAPLPSFLSPRTVSNLPENFPGREALIEADITSWAQVASMTNDELVAVKGIGGATANRILGVMNS